jgi:hypothetical protein
MEVFIQVFIALALYEFLYWLIYTLISNYPKKGKVDQEAQEYLKYIKSKSDSEESLKNKKD